MNKAAAITPNTPASQTREAVSFCRICSGGCGTRLTIDANDRIVGVRGDQENPLTNGYACFKGLQAAEAHNSPDRILRAQKRGPDGRFSAIPLEQALDEIAAKMATLMAADGPDVAAVFCGNGSMPNSTAYPMLRSFLNAIGSRQFFSTLTIDQSAKMISFGRLGAWAGGAIEFDDMDVALMFGANPLISHAASGMLAVDPVRQLKRAKANGLKLIVVDPRRSETAHFADVLLQPYPGQDAAIAAGLIRMILAEGWEDADFCAAHVGAARMAALKAAVEPFLPEMVEQRAGLQPGQLRTVAEMFARDGKTGIAYASTGPNMTPFSNLAQHLVEDLNVVCGRFPREGDPVRRTNMQAPRLPRVAQVIPPCRAWEAEEPSRIRGAGSLFGERLSGTLADEILTPGKGRIRALIIDGGNLALSLPDQRRAVEALSALDLLVCIEPWMTPTAKLAHYILPPRMQYEHPDVCLNVPGFDFWPGSWNQYTPTIVSPPPGAETVEDWYVFWSIAKRLGKVINYAGKGALDMTTPPTADELLALRLADSQAPLHDLTAHAHGRDFQFDLGAVGPAAPDNDAKFDVMPDDVAGELDLFRRTCDENGRLERDGRRYKYLMSTRRVRDVFNSTGTQLQAVRKRTPHNPAYLNGVDMAALGVKNGDLVEIRTSHGAAVVYVEQDDHMRPGVVATTHGWGGLPGANEDPSQAGTCVNLLINADRYCETINAMPHFSAVPVDILPVRRNAAE